MATSSFAADIEKFARKIKGTLDEVHRGVVLELFSSVIMDTPVDEGHLRGAWNVSQDQPDTSVSQTPDKTGNATVAKVMQNPGHAGSVTYLTNPLPYAVVAEYGLWSTGSADQEDSKVTPQGYSKKAPAGMVRRNMARVKRNMGRAVIKAKRTKK